MWAETYYVPANSAEPHRWFTNHFQPFPTGLEDNDKDHEYGAYIWPFFMQQEKGAPAVFQTWSAIEGVNSGDFKGVTNAIDGESRSTRPSTTSPSATST